MEFSHMVMIPFPVLCKCRNILNMAKTAKIKCKDNQIIKSISDFFISICVDNDKLHKIIGSLGICKPPTGGKFNFKSRAELTKIL